MSRRADIEARIRRGGGPIKIKLPRETPESTDEKTCALMAQQIIEIRNERDAAIQRT